MTGWRHAWWVWLGWVQGSGLCAGTAGRLCFKQAVLTVIGLCMLGSRACMTVIGLCMLGSRAQGCAGVRMGDVLGTEKT